MKVDKRHEVVSRKQAAIDYWKGHVSACKESGLRKSIYCQRHQLSYSRMMYWQKKLEQKTKTVLVQVKLKADPEEAVTRHQPLCTLLLSDGHILKIHDGKALSILLDRWR